jgi:peptidoglycan/LPS O-acetylase OafA/YrhL
MRATHKLSPPNYSYLLHAALCLVYLFFNIACSRGYYIHLFSILLVLFAIFTMVLSINDTSIVGPSRGYRDLPSPTYDDDKEETPIILDHYAEYAYCRRPNKSSLDDIIIDAFRAINTKWTTKVSNHFPALPRLTISIARDTCLFLIPSFIYIWNPQVKAKKLHPTAYLDGLRGVAASFVVFHHWALQLCPTILEGYGSENINIWLIQLPIVRIIYSGSFMVSLFYVLSGFVLSVRGLKLARMGKQAEFLSSMASSAFRRWLRLHLPVFASMIFSMILTYMELWVSIRPEWYSLPPAVTARGYPLSGGSIADSSTIEKRRFVWPTHPGTLSPKLRSFSEQLWSLFDAFQDISDPFRFGSSPNNGFLYSPGVVLWTIPVEWIGSMVVFAVVLALAWTKSWTRLTVVTLLTWWCHRNGRWELGMFMMGLIFAEIMCIRDAWRASRAARVHLGLPPDEQKVSTTEVRTWRDKILLRFWIVMFTCGIFFGSQPMLRAHESTGWVYLMKSIPAWWNPAGNFYYSVGSSLIMLSLMFCEPLQRIFTSNIAQYLGRISFSLYLLHVHVLWTVGTRVFPWCMRIVGGGDTEGAYGVAMISGTAIVLSITVWISDVFARGVDEKSVAFARWVWQKVMTF